MIAPTDSSLDLLRLQGAAVMAAASAVLITDRTGTIVWANPAFTVLSGYTLEEALGKNPRDLVRSGRQDRSVYAQMWETIMAGRTWQGELTNRRKDGTVYVESLTITPVRDAVGGISHFIAIKQELTARKQAEETLRASELRYRRLFESAKDGILILDADTGMVVDVNPYLIVRLGFSREQFLGKAIWELGFFKDIVANKVSFLELQQHEYIRYEDKPLETATGERFDVEFISNVYLVNQQRVIQCNIRDITARKISEHRLREQSAILANSHEGVIIVDLANAVTLWNRGAEDIFGWTAAEALGRPPADLLGIADAEVIALFNARLKRDGVWNQELLAQTRGGRKITVDCRVTLVRDEAGQPRAHLGILSDVTEKKQLEKTFLRAQRLEAIGTLSSGIAHDLNNILAPILMAAGLLRETSRDPHQRELTMLIEGSARRGANIIRQLLTFSRGVTGHRVPVQLRHLLVEMADIVRETFPRNINLMLEPASGLWPVVADTTQLHQVLMNLCVNARDAMADGGDLTLAAKNVAGMEPNSLIGMEGHSGPYVLLSISDTGRGIPGELIDRIFEPFFTTKGISHGSGLGLSTVLGIVRSHGGFITVSSKVNHGTTFHVYLPAAPDNDLSDAPDEKQPLAPAHGQTILLVDDEEAILAATRHGLEDHGYRVLTARNGQEALEVFAGHASEIRLVLTDVMMPVMDGLQLARELRRRGATLPILAVTGLEPVANDAAVKSGIVAGFLAKPTDRHTLLAAVQRQLELPSPGP